MPLFHGIPLLVDVTMASPLHANGAPVRGAAATDGVALAAAEARKEVRYPELCNNPAAQLVVLACETGGRWSEQAAEFVMALARAKARAAPAALSATAVLCWHRRWCGMMAVAAQAALAATLLGSEPWAAAGRDGYVPGLDQVLEATEPAWSWLPPRSED